VLALATRLGVKTFPGLHEGATSTSPGTAKRFTGDIPPDPFALPDLGLAMRRIDQLARQVPLAPHGSAATAQRWDALTFESWIRRIKHRHRRP